MKNVSLVLIATLVAVLSLAQQQTVPKSAKQQAALGDNVQGRAALTTANTIPKLSAAGTLGHSAVTDNGTSVTVTGRHFLFALDNTWDIGASGATRPRDLFLGRNLAVSGTTSLTGALTFSADNTVDIGANGATRPANLWLGNNLNAVGAVLGQTGVSTNANGYFNWAASSTLRAPSNGKITLLNSAETDFSLLQFGGTTASFPALKRSSAALEARLADDSASAAFSAAPGGSVPAWAKYTLTKIANSVSGCASADIAAASYTPAGAPALDDATSGGTYTTSGDHTYTAIIDGKDAILTVAAVPTAGGLGYAAEDVLTLTTGDANATVRVLTVDGGTGAVLAVELVARGTGYAVAAGQATAGGSGDGNATIEVTALVDTFKWQKDAGAFTEDVLMTGVAQALEDGITIAFAAITGHTLLDQWAIVVTDLGCWQVNTGAPVAATAGLTQNVVLFQLPARAFVEGLRIKTATACAGAATIATGAGTADNNVYFRAQDFDLKAAVTNTNYTDTLAAAGSTTAAAVNFVASLIDTVDNITAIDTGCAVDFWVRYAVLP